MREILDNYEIFVMVFGGLLILVYFIYSTWLKRKSEYSELESLEQKRVYKDSKSNNKKEEVTTFSKEDRERFKEMLTVLPLEGGSISFIMSHNMEESFHSSKLDELYTFYYDCSGVKNSFVNSQLEEKKEHVHELVGEYIELLSQNLNSLEMSRLQAVKGLPVLEAKAKKIVKSYTELIETTEKRLSASAL